MAWFAKRSVDDSDAYEGDDSDDRDEQRDADEDDVDADNGDDNDDDENESEDSKHQIVKRLKRDVPVPQHFEGENNIIEN